MICDSYEEVTNLIVLKLLAGYSFVPLEVTCSPCVD